MNYIIFNTILRKSEGCLSFIKIVILHDEYMGISYSLQTAERQLRISPPVVLVVSVTLPLSDC